MWLDAQQTCFVAPPLTLVWLNKIDEPPFSSTLYAKHQERNYLPDSFALYLPSIAPQCRHLFN